MSGSVIVPHQIPSPSVEVIPTALGNDIHTVLLVVGAVVVTNEATKADANATAVRLHTLTKQVESHVEPIKKQLNGLLGAVRECASNALDPLIGAKKRVLQLIASYDADVAKRASDLQAAVDCANRKKLEEAEAERVRMQAIANEEHQKRMLAAAAQAKIEAAEAAALGLDISDAPPVVAAPVVAAPKVELAKAAIVAPTASAATTRKMPKLVIDEQHPVWWQFNVGGEVLVTVNRAAVKRVLDSGVVLPWARIEMVEEVAMARSL